MVTRKRVATAVWAHNMHMYEYMHILPPSPYFALASRSPKIYWQSFLRIFFPRAPQSVRPIRPESAQFRVFFIVVVVTTAAAGNCINPVGSDNTGGASIYIYKSVYLCVFNRRDVRWCGNALIIRSASSSGDDDGVARGAPSPPLAGDHRHKLRIDFVLCDLFNSCIFVSRLLRNSMSDSS